MFSNLSASSISFATVTPSLVMRGAPKDLSITTLRPFGPSVDLDRVGEDVDAAQHLVARIAEKLTTFAAMELSPLKWGGVRRPSSSRRLAFDERP
jgi:hypothetical protein